MPAANFWPTNLGLSDIAIEVEKKRLERWNGLILIATFAQILRSLEVLIDD